MEALMLVKCKLRVPVLVCNYILVTYSIFVIIMWFCSGKITIKVLPPSGGSKFEDEPDESLSILDNYKASSAAVDFMNQMRAGQDRIKLSTKKSQKHKAHRKRR